MTKELYRPKCIVEYDRLAFVHEDNNIRVTFDQHLRAGALPDSFFSETPIFMPVSAPGEITLEVKYDGFLHSGIKMALSDNLPPNQSRSKYCTARESLMI